MKNILLALIAFVFILSSCQEEKLESQPFSIGDFTFSSEEIVHNQPFEITYNGEEPLGIGFYHNVVHNTTYPNDLVFDGKKATLTIPDSVGMVSFIFKINDEYNMNNGNGYLFFTINTDGDKSIDAIATKENYLLNEGSFYDLNGGDVKKTFKAIDEVIANHNDLKENWFMSHLQTASRMSKEKTNTLLDSYLSEINLNSSSNLKDYQKAKSIYSAARQFDKNDSINALIIEKFPESKDAKEAVVEKYFDFKTFEERINYFETAKLADYKTSNINYVYSNVANLYFRKNNLEKFEEFSNKISLSKNKASMLNNLAWNSAEKGENLEYASKLSKESLDLISEEMKVLAEKSDFYSPNQYKESLSYSYKMYADTYAFVRYKLGDLEQAIEYQEKVVDKGQNPDYNERYIQFLSEDEQYNKVIEKATTYVEQGNATNEIKAYLKTAYEKTSPDVDFDALLAQLDAKAKEKLKTEIKQKMMDVEAPDFVAKNFEGEDVSLASLRGKTVILDFWATWCGPCIASFPGMQNAVNKYKDNENVEFLFVDTMENGKNRLETVKSFIDKNNYTFHVLIDPYSADTKSYAIASAYGVSGIPTKAIIDKNGKMRFKDVGFSGSADKLESKIDAMIELLQ